MLFVLFMFMDSLFHTNRVHGADMKSMPSIPPRRLRSKFGRVEGCYMLHRLGMLTVGHFFGHKNIASEKARNKKTYENMQGYNGYKDQDSFSENMADGLLLQLV